MRLFFQVYQIDGRQISLTASEQFESHLTRDWMAPFEDIRSIYSPMIIEGTFKLQQSINVNMHLDDGIVWLVVRDLKCYSLNLKKFVDTPIIPYDIRSSPFLLYNFDNKLQALCSKLNLN